MEAFDVNVNILVEAKNSYTRRLSDIMTPIVYRRLEEIYDESNSLKDFQDKLKGVPKWNQDEIDAECEKVNSACPWVYDLVSAVFITNTKILTVVKLNNQRRKLDVTIPNLNRFVHRVYVESAREFFKNPVLLDREGKKSMELQSIMRESLTLIDGAIENAIRNLLPFQEILKNYLSDVPPAGTSPVPEPGDPQDEGSSSSSSATKSASHSDKGSASSPSPSRRGSASASDHEPEVKTVAIKRGKKGKATHSASSITKLDEEQSEGEPHLEGDGEGEPHLEGDGDGELQDDGDSEKSDSAPWEVNGEVISLTDIESDGEVMSLPEIRSQVESEMGSDWGESDGWGNEIMGNPFARRMQAEPRRLGDDASSHDGTEDTHPISMPDVFSDHNSEGEDDEAGEEKAPSDDGEVIDEPPPLEEVKGKPPPLEEVKGEPSPREEVKKEESDLEEDIVRLGNKRRIPKMKRKHKKAKKPYKKEKKYNFFDIPGADDSSSAF